MQAAFYTRKGPAAEVLQVGELDVPEPSVGEVRVRIKVSAVNPSDTKNRGGHRGNNSMPFALIIPHQDGSGVIDAVGKGVSPERIGCVALYAGGQGGLIAAMESGLFVLMPVLGQPLAPRLLASISHGQAGMRCNDGRCDRAGRFWVSTMVRDMGLAAPQGVLYRLDDAPQ
ncbi:MAG: hypothetical protein EBW20_09280, partial [Betaproteobacteria bacterium]|nr:hypothetical protein [Betaproteobacteria bacterium]